MRPQIDSFDVYFPKVSTLLVRTYLFKPEMLHGTDTVNGLQANFDYHIRWWFVGVEGEGAKMGEMRESPGSRNP